MLSIASKSICSINAKKTQIVIVKHSVSQLPDEAA